MMHKPHTNQPLVELKTSSSYFHLSFYPSLTVFTPQCQRWVMTEDTQCSSIIRFLKTAKAPKIVHYLESPLSHCPHLPSCSSGRDALNNTHAITS